MLTGIQDVFEVRTDSGGNPRPTRIGRTWTQAANVRILEVLSPDGIPVIGPPTPYIFQKTVEETSTPGLKPVETLRRPSFEYCRRGSDQWQSLVWENGVASLNGSPLSSDELRRLLAHLDAGAAELRYANDPLHKACNDVFSATTGSVDLTQDSETGLGNLVAFETALRPALCFMLRSYDRLWRQDPERALELLRTAAATAKALGGQWFHLHAGALAVEVANPEEAVGIARRLSQAMAQAAVGAAGMGEVVGVLVSEGGPDFAPAMARIAAGSGALFGEQVVSL